MLGIFNRGRKAAAGQRRSLAGKVAVVTGSSTGIGAAIAKALASAGAKVIVSSTDAAGCSIVEREINESGGEAASIPCDVADEAQVIALIDGAIARWGSLDVMVNNAGIDDMASVLSTGTELWRKVLAVNLDGVFFGTKHAALRMKDRNKGRIINISSVAGLRGFYKRAAYCAAKAGVVGLTRAAAADLGKHGITVNAICPGITRTRMTEAFMKDGRAVDAFIKGMPVKRVGIPEDIAAVAVFLAGDDAGYVTGQAIVVDGGWSMHV